MTYGYLAIFLLVFLQEIGVPNPVSNELVLVFSGSLAYTHTLSLPLIVVSAVGADIIGTTVLYFAFYYFGQWILSRKIMRKLKNPIERMIERIRKHGNTGVFVGRLIPFVRGYASVAAGLLHIKPRIFLIQVIASALLWTGGYVMLGRYLGKYWMNAKSLIVNIERAAIGGIVLTIIIFTVHRFISKRGKHKKAPIK